ncbi:MAG: hypothetical protein A2X87_03760 [Deltaproteobacteria bacterium GWC2_42_51]|nr:MAG: hypothetical protein A2067_04035 [Deltaproteobacteria bacterium GWB2_42_7]OGP37474.1 MAG: hypothetical protein A2X87_03760 [Deltaproteobacteria bacterium GWC2_42_51]OGP39367.1 MAG: hypothetical protein A2090_10520 [Deltaproteobacteria bacterium GWD2_42_10]OGP47561.1 MAG: hypothetical protein A2022_09195 [Deltaproteobacteria bacterium GWF2_42_12]OGQ24897.1 MAG: hypothetical protein A3D29_00600 [Deltaproteobacteria bacterium RIFCSPHIGHO2_02_FULL_42_44]OGQ37848.1 MAG: hypothetical protein
MTTVISSQYAVDSRQKAITIYDLQFTILNLKSKIVNLKFLLLLTAYCLLLTGSAFAQETIKESLSELNRILPLKKVVKEPWGRDPFVPLVAGVAMEADLKLTAIIYSEKKPSVIINNKILYIGDSVEGQKIIDITKQYVILRGISGSYKLEIGNIVGQSYGFKKTQ